MDEIYERLNVVLRDFFDDDETELTPETTDGDIEDWDSLDHITLMAAVEEEFGVRFTMGQVSGMKNVGEMVEIIAANS